MLCCPRLAWILPMVLAVQAAGCSNSKTVVLVTVNGAATGIYQLHVKVKAGALNTEIFVPSTPGALIVLPTDFTIEMDRSRKGALTLTVDGRDLSNAVVATGTASLPALVVGGRNNITVTLGSGTQPPPDGGDTDAGADAGDDAGDDAGEPADAGPEAGVDAEEDGGVDGDPDAGVDAGLDGAIGGDTEGLLDAEGLDAGDDV